MKKIKFRVVGKKPQNFIQALYNRNIKIYNLVIKENELVCSVDSAHFSAIQALYANSNYKIEIISVPKYLSIKDFFRSSVGFLLALAIVVAGICFYSCRIWQYRIYGLESVEMAQVVAALNEFGATKGAEKSKIDLKHLTNSLIENVDGIALASASIVGTTLVVTISEKIDNSALLSENEPIVAKTACIITKIATTAGTALVQVGDKVAKGQILIANYIVDSNGAQISSKARGQISVKAYYSLSKSYYTNQIKLERTGKKQKVISIENDNATACQFQKYEVETKTYYISSIIPLKVTETIYYELVEKKYVIDVEKEEQNLIELTKKETKEKYSIQNFEEELVNINNQSDGGKQITITYVVDENIIV